MKWYIDNYTVNYNELGSSTTCTANLFPKFYDSYPMFIMARVKTAFAGVTHPTVKIGNGTVTDCYMKDQPIDQIMDLIPGASPNAQGYCEAMFMESRTKSFATSSQGKIVATFTSASGNFSSLTAGEIEFVFGYIK